MTKPTKALLRKKCEHARIHACSKNIIAGNLLRPFDTKNPQDAWNMEGIKSVLVMSIESKYYYKKVVCSLQKLGRLSSLRVWSACN